MLEVRQKKKEEEEGETYKSKLSEIPNEGIEFAVAQLCSAHLHFHASEFLQSTSYHVNSHMRSLENLFLFLDMFLERRGKQMEKKEGWGECRKFCAQALQTFRSDQQGG